MKLEIILCFLRCIYSLRIPNIHLLFFIKLLSSVRHYHVWSGIYCRSYHNVAILFSLTRHLQITQTFSVVNFCNLSVYRNTLELTFENSKMYWVPRIIIRWCQLCFLLLICDFGFKQDDSFNNLSFNILFLY